MARSRRFSVVSAATALALSVGLAVLSPGTASAEFEEDARMRTFPNESGLVRFDRWGDEVWVDDWAPRDGWDVRLRVGHAPRYQLRTRPGNPSIQVCGGCYPAGHKYNLPEPGPWWFQICLVRDGRQPRSCNSEIWYVDGGRP